MRFDLGDTRLPPAPASTGSSTVASAGSAVLLAAQNLRKQLVALAISDGGSPLSGVPEDELKMADGRLYAKGDPGRGETCVELLKRQKRSFLSAEAIAAPGAEQGVDHPQPPGGPPQRLEHPHHAYASFGAQFCEVRVDPFLGEVRLIRMTGCFAGGRVLNARTARSQLLGGMVWGIGMALTERNQLDPGRGWFSSPDLGAYLLPVNADTPPIDVLLVEEHDPYVNPLGAKGLGELGICGAAAAVANAVFHATGKRIRDLPITPDKLIL